MYLPWNKEVSMRKKILFLFVILFSLYLLVCGKGPNKFTEYTNYPPDTFITKKTLSKVEISADSLGNPTNVCCFDYAVFYVGTDIDGEIDSFTYRIDGGIWTGILKKEFKGIFTMNTEVEEHYFEVYATDNKGKDDPTPAKAVFSLAEIAVNKAPTTAIESGPENGMETGAGVTFGLSGADEDGFVSKFLYILDGTTQGEISANADGKAALEFGISKDNILPAGNHSISVQAVDNYGKVDKTPAVISFLVKEGFAPIINFTAGPADGGGWFGKVDAVFSFGVTLSHYAGALSGYSYAFDSETEFSDWTTASTITISGDDITDGDHYFLLQAKDTGGSISQSKISFSAAAASFEKDIVLLDHCNSGQNVSNDEIVQMFADIGYPIDYVTDEFDLAFFKPGELGKYKTAVIFTDNGYYFPEILMGAYVKAGGNIFFSSYNFINNFSSSFRQEILGISGAWDGYRTDTPVFAGSGPLAGMSITLSSTSAMELLRADSRDGVYGVLYGIDGSYTSYPRGVFVDNAPPFGNVFSMAQSFRRLIINDGNKAIIKAIMDLLAGVTSVQ